MNFPVMHVLMLTLSAASAVAQLPFRTAIPAPGNATGFGIGLSRMPDLNADGRADFAVAEVRSAVGSPVDRVHLYATGFGTLLRTHSGLVEAEQFGAAITELSDVDSDGTADYAIAAPRSDLAASEAGRVVWISGASGTVLRTTLGVLAGSACGSALLRVPDVNADGIDELLIASGGEDPPGPASGGVVRLHSGADATVLWMTAGGDPSEDYGHALALIGDVDTDGLPDLAITVPSRRDPVLQMRTGEVEVRSSVTGSLLFTIKETTGTNFNHRFGQSVTAVNDLTGDGIAELLVGITGDDAAGTNVGAALLCSGADGSAIVRHLGQPQGSVAFGALVESRGDVNADGVPDYAIAADSFGTTGYSGYLRVYSGSDHTLLHTIQSGVPNDGFGSAMLGIGDWDGDGLPDWLVGAKQARTVRVVSPAGARGYGENSEPAQVLDLNWVSVGAPNAADGWIGLFGGNPGAGAFMGVALTPANVLVNSTTILIDPTDPSLFLAPITLDNTGSFVSPPTSLREPTLHGVSLFLQAIVVDANSPAGFWSSAGLELRPTR